MNERSPRTVSGGGQDESVAIRCGLAERCPCVHIHPRMVVVRGNGLGGREVEITLVKGLQDAIPVVEEVFR